MLEKLTRNWWIFALRGLVAIIFGIVAAIQIRRVISGESENLERKNCNED